MIAQHKMLTDFQGIRTTIAKPLYVFLIFRGGGGGGGVRNPCPPLDPRMIVAVKFGEIQPSALGDVI